MKVGDAIAFKANGLDFAGTVVSMNNNGIFVHLENDWPTISIRLESVHTDIRVLPWVSNTHETDKHKWVGYYIGEPVSSEKYPVEEMKKMGMSGVYRRSETDHYDGGSDQ